MILDMVEGFWIVQVEAVQGSGGGVVVLTKGQIFGGDNGFYYLGRYEVIGASLRARVTVRKFLPEIQSIFGIEGDYELDLSGDIKEDVVEGKAVVVGRPGAGIVV